MTDAQNLTRLLGGHWRGHSGNAPCPVCQPERRLDQDGLSLRNTRERLLLHCHKSDCAFADIVRAAGLPPVGPCDYPRVLPRYDSTAFQKDGKRENQAKAIWAESRPVHSTLAETYLRNRGITCALPDTLRFHPHGWHQTGHHWPMLVAQVDGAARFAVHRTYLDSLGGKAKVDPPKAMLGTCAGGAVRLSQAEGPLVVCEGIETGLSLLCGMLRRPATVWAALSTSGLRGLHLPPNPGRLTIASDGDAPGREAAQALAFKAQALGWQVSLLPAPDGRDWNDIVALKRGAA